MSMMGTAVSGMLADSNWLSTISQNVSNANTTGYKTAETDFAAVVDAVGSTTSAGGGVTTSVISLNSLQGDDVGTSTDTNLAISGDGYFVVSDSSGDLFLTRNGSFTTDSSGNLVNSAGYYLMGYNVQDGSAAGASNSLAGMTKVNVTASGDKATATTSGTLSVNLDADATAVTATADLPSANATTSTYTSETSIVTYDDLGGSQTVNVYYTKTGANTWEVDAYNAADATDGGFPYSSGPIATATLNFDSTTGALSSVTENGTTNTTGTFTFTVPTGQSMTLNMSSTTQLESAFSVNASTVNGNAPSSLTGISFSSTGTLSFEYSNGETSAAYDIPLATVASEDSLTSITGGVYEANEKSGTVRVGTAGSAGLGTIASSELEDSTVDLATELTQMIEAQSSYQANSKVFQTGSDILDILNNLKS